MKYDRVIRWLHASLAFLISAQLLSSLVMQVPRPGRERLITALGSSSFQLHRLTGMIVLLILCMHWVWSLSGHLPGGLAHLFPWADRKRISHIIADIKLILQLRIRDFPMESTLAGAVHGLGLIVASLMVLTGAFLYFGISPAGEMSSFVHSMKKAHELIAKLMWAYLIGHVSMGTLHQWIGHKTVSEMFNLIRKSPPPVNSGL